MSIEDPQKANKQKRKKPIIKVAIFLSNKEIKDQI
jgi:hypothetical protein